MKKKIFWRKIITTADVANSKPPSVVHCINATLSAQSRFLPPPKMKTSACKKKNSNAQAQLHFPDD